MSGWKLYKSLTDVDGSVFWYVDGKKLTNVTYHSTYNLYKFYDWDVSAKLLASEYDNALSILADYFGEEPTKEQLDTRQCKCWKLHLAFSNEESMGKSLISSDDITEWIEYKTKQFSEEDYIILMLKNLSLPILITKSNNDLDQYVWSYLDGKGIENSFAEALKSALEFNMFKIRNHNIFR